MRKSLTFTAVAVLAGICLMQVPAYASKINPSQDANMYSASVEGGLTATDLMARASQSFMARDIESAILYMNKAIELEPQKPVLYLNRGYLKHVVNDLNGAMDDYNTALKINPNYEYAYNNRGVLKVGIGDTQGAMEDYAKALNINPRYSDVYYNRGNLKYMLSDNDGALKDFDKAIELNPKDSEAYNNRGVVKKRLDFNVGALSDYSQSIALNPKDSIAYANRGRLKKLYFDNEGAAIDLDQAVALAETQTFIKNVKPLVSNERYIAAVPVVNGITPDNPTLTKIAIKESEKLTEVQPPKNLTKISSKTDVTPKYAQEKKNSGDRIALANPAGAAGVNRGVNKGVNNGVSKGANKGANSNIKALNTAQKSVNTPKTTTPVLNAGIGTVKALEVPDIRTSKVTDTPTTNVKLAESYYIRGLQKCVLRDLKGAVADLDKAIANNTKYADAYFYRGAIRKELGDIDGFRKDYAAAIEINPSLQKFNDSNALGLVRG